MPLELSPESFDVLADRVCRAASGYLAGLDGRASFPATSGAATAEVFEPAPARAGCGQRCVRRPDGDRGPLAAWERAVLRLRAGVGGAGRGDRRPVRFGAQPERDRLAVGACRSDNRAHGPGLARRGHRVRRLHWQPGQRRFVGESHGPGDGTGGQGAREREGRTAVRGVCLRRGPHVSGQGAGGPWRRPCQPAAHPSG